MKTLFFRLANGLQFMVIPDTQAHLDGHTIITHTYSVFRDNGRGNPLLARSKESTLHLEKINDPDYCGFITFEKPVPSFLIRPTDNLNLVRKRRQNLLSTSVISGTIRRFGTLKSYDNSGAIIARVPAIGH